MKIQIEIRRPRRPRARVLLAAGVLLAVAVPFAWAGHQFADVPGTNPHHDDVAAIRGAGVTTGCNPPANTLYCPDQPVRRDQMASFLRRGFGRVSFGSDDTGSLTTEAGAADQGLFSVRITPAMASGVSGAAGFVKADAEVVVRLASAGASCPCEVHLGLWSPDNADNEGFLDGAFYSEAVIGPANPSVTLPITGVMRVTSATPKTVWVAGHHHGSDEAFDVFSNVSLTYVPFGPTGTDAGPVAPAAVAGADSERSIPSRRER